MPCPSKRAESKRRTPRYTPPAIGFLPIPDPRGWPADIRNWYRQMAGDDSGPLHVFIFNHGRFAAMYLQDAVTGLGILDVDPSEWHIDGGFPAFQFAPEKIDDYSRRLRAAGYIVGGFEPAEKIAAHATTGRSATVIDIARVRSKRSDL